MCTTYELTASDLLAKWFTFSAQKNDCELTLGILEDFSKVIVSHYTFYVAFNPLSEGNPALLF